MEGLREEQTDPHGADVHETQPQRAGESAADHGGAGAHYDQTDEAENGSTGVAVAATSQPSSRWREVDYNSGGGHQVTERPQEPGAGNGCRHKR